MLIAELDERSGRELPLRAHLHRSALKLIQVAHHQQQVGGFLHRKEPASRDVDACVCVVKEAIR